MSILEGLTLPSNIYLTAKEELENGISKLKEHLETIEGIAHIKDNTATILAVEVTKDKWAYDTVKNKYKYTIK